MTLRRLNPSLFALALAAPAAAAAELPKHKLPPSPDGSLVIGSCDGQTTLEIKGKKAGEALSHAEAQEAAAQLMDQWQKKHPEQPRWRLAEQETPRQPARTEREANREGPGAAPPQQPETRAAPEQQGTYANYTATERHRWQVEQDKLIARGKEIFHSAQLLNSKTGISCDMCHPDAANTHPETYPKYQVQLNRVAMLRDMINWCIENPVKGSMIPEDDARMRALEAYITAQRKGVPLAPGKH